MLDSSVVIAAERRGDSVQSFAEAIRLMTSDVEAVLSSIGLTELAYAVFRSPSAALRDRNQRFLDDLLIAFNVSPYDRDAALLAARIDAEQRARGITIPNSDLMIGATALSLGFSVLTHNLRHFNLIPGLQVIAL